MTLLGFLKNKRTLQRLTHLLVAIVLVYIIVFQYPSYHTCSSSRIQNQILICFSFALVNLLIGVFHHKMLWWLGAIMYLVYYIYRFGMFLMRILAVESVKLVNSDIIKLIVYVVTGIISFHIILKLFPKSQIHSLN
jgi:hypothetical protein